MLLHEMAAPITISAGMMTRCKNGSASNCAKMLMKKKMKNGSVSKNQSPLSPRKGWARKASAKKA